MNWNTVNRNPVRPGRHRGRRGKQAQHWLRAGILAGILLSLLMFAVSGTALGLQWSRYRQSEQLYRDLRTQSRDTASAGSGEDTGGNRASQKDFSSLQAGSPDTVAWITGEDTPIDYPVMHTDNNEYYLSYLYSGEENRYGALFADCRNTVIYGHNMKNDAMFGSLMGYKQAYYEEHPTMTLYTPDGDYTIELLSGTLENSDREFVRFRFESEEDFTGYIQSLQSRSTFSSHGTAVPGDRLVSLCTCTYEQNNARYLVVGRLLPVSESGAQDEKGTVRQQDSLQQKTAWNFPGCFCVLYYSGSP